jgi:hypothetical protein
MEDYDMSVPMLKTGALENAAKVSEPERLVSQTIVFARPMFAAVAEAYLQFRRVYYHEHQPSLATIPPAHAGIHQAELARVAESTLRVLPKVVKSFPILGSFLDHLQEVANLHSITERERTALHNMTITFLHGIKDGIQSWYVEWLLASAHRLSDVTDAHYYLTYPWDALLYLPPTALALLDTAVRTDNTPAIEHEIEQLASRLIKVLRDPIGTQPELAFTGPDGERHKRVFHLKTAVALALGAYLVADEVHTSLHPPTKATALGSVLAPLPADTVPIVASHAPAESTMGTLWTPSSPTSD